MTQTTTSAPGVRHGYFRLTSSIADAVVIKEGDLFLLTRPDGEVPPRGRHGFGLYYHDCRFLSGYALRLGSKAPRALMSTASEGYRCTTELTNPQLHADSGPLEPASLGIRWERTIDPGEPALRDSITVRNMTTDSIRVPLTLTWKATFDDVFAVRGIRSGRRGRLHAPAWDGSRLVFRYDGADGTTRLLAVDISPHPDVRDGGAATLDVELGVGDHAQIQVALMVAEVPHERASSALRHRRGELRPVQRDLEQSAHRWLEAQPRIRTDSRILSSVLDRSLRDLCILRSQLRSQCYFAAGVPWFATLFGRDSIIAALESLAFAPQVAADTLRLLGDYQGRRDDETRAEQPGKILHELRVGELAHRGDIPQTPYYGSIDATPLFLVLLARHALWTGEMKVFEELQGHVDAALRWVAEYGDRDHDGYLEYLGSSEKCHLANQGWKDSGDAISNADGSLAHPPIALVEVQGYTFLAKQGIAQLYEQAGDGERARTLRHEAEALRGRFNRDFWIERAGYFALALQREREPAVVVSSNPGQALWTGIVDADLARRTVSRLMADDMWTGWGIRTLSSRERRYSPIGYHVGTVWPHDNALIAGGFRRYGADHEAARIFAGIVEAAAYFRYGRLPEVFAGFRREDYHEPVRYPVACHPQAWAAGAVPYLLERCLGLEPNGFDRYLRIVRPVLPDFVDTVDVDRLHVGVATVDIRFRRTRGGSVACEVKHVEGPLEVAMTTS